MAGAVITGSGSASREADPPWTSSALLGEESAPALPAPFHTFSSKGSDTGAFSWLWSQTEMGPSKLSCCVITPHSPKEGHDQHLPHKDCCEDSMTWFMASYWCSAGHLVSAQ